MVFSTTASRPPARLAPTKIKYVPLDLSSSHPSFRVAILQPGPRTAGIRVDLQNTSLSARPSYEALSYTWGSASPVKSVEINGTKTEIRDNLWYALANLRDVTESRCLWVDAICIDQSNDEEKNNQVRLMALIFRRAERVLVWLGQNMSNHAGGRQALIISPGAIEKRGPEAKGIDQRAKTPYIASQRDKSGVLDLGSLGSPSQNKTGGKLDEYHNLCTRPYWNRLWIIQEILAADSLRVHWGQDSAPWDDFFAQLREANPLDSNSELPFQLARQREGRFGNSQRLLNLVDACQNSLCVEPRDKIYGFVGIAHDSQALPVDYKKSLFEVYEDVIRFHCDSADRDSPHSSLVYTSQLVQRVLGGILKMNRDLLQNNGKPLQPITKMDDLQNVLKTSGISAGSVIEVGPTFFEFIAASKEGRSWETTLYKCDAPDGESLRRMDAGFQRVLLKCYEPELAKIVPIKTAVTWEISKDKENSTYKLGLDTQQANDPPESPTSLANDCRLFLTDNFLIGLAPTNLMKGDHLVQFWKSDAVAVVRDVESTSSPGTYHRRVVGRAVMATKRFNKETRFHVPGVTEPLLPTQGDDTPIYLDPLSLSLLTQ